MIGRELYRTPSLCRWRTCDGSEFASACVDRDVSLSERARERGIVTLVIGLVLIAALLLELNLLGVTNFPIVRPQRTKRDAALARVLLGAKNQCRFGHALVSAGHPQASKRASILHPLRFARVYAQSFGGASEDERRRIERACLTGLSRRTSRR